MNWHDVLREWIGGSELEWEGEDVVGVGTKTITKSQNQTNRVYGAEYKQDTQDKRMKR